MRASDAIRPAEPPHHRTAPGIDAPQLFLRDDGEARRRLDGAVHLAPRELPLPPEHAGAAVESHGRAVQAPEDEDRVEHHGRGADRRGRHLPQNLRGSGASLRIVARRGQRRPADEGDAAGREAHHLILNGNAVGVAVR